MPSIKRGHKVFQKTNLTHEIKPSQKNESELGYIYISFMYRSSCFYRQHLKIICKLCTPVCLEVRGISHGTNSKNSLDTNLENIFN